MGCNSSKPASQIKNAKAAQSSRLVDLTTSIISLSATDEVNTILPADLYRLITGTVKKIELPSGGVPCVCLSEYSFPLLLTSLIVDNQPFTKMPVISLSFENNSRIACFCHYKLFTSYFKKEDFAQLLKNIVLWLSQEATKKTPVFIAEASRPLATALTMVFHTLGYHVVKGKITQIENFNLAVVFSDIDLQREDRFKTLTNYVQTGGGLLVIYVPSKGQLDNSINKLLVNYGLSYTTCSLSPDEYQSTIEIIPPLFDIVEKYTMPQLIDNFLTFLFQKKEDVEYLDDLATNLRYHIAVCGSPQIGDIITLYDSMKEYLKATGFRDNGKLCSTTQQAIVASLIEDIRGRLPLSSISAAMTIDFFPGICDEEPKNFVIEKMRIIPDQLLSTGLWANAGCKINVHCTGTDIDLQMQIGSHNTQLFINPNPWKRWPSVVASYDIAPNSDTPISSYYGGLIYIAKNCNTDTCPFISVNLSFDKVIQAPVYNVDNPEIFDKTKNSSAPWGEIQSKSIIFTLPSKLLRSLTKIKEIMDFYQLIPSLIEEKMNYLMIRPYRLVFDVEIIKDRLFDYPISLSLDDFDDIMNPEIPSMPIYKAIMCMVASSLMADYFDSDTEIAITYVITSDIMYSLYPDFQLNNFEINFPQLFYALWDIHKKISPTALPLVLGQSYEQLDAIEVVQEDKWVSFVRDMCLLGKYNFVPLFSKYRVVPMNFTECLQGLPIPII